jgi:hypothetical protein
MERVTAHFWASGQLYEVDYFKAVGHGGQAKVFKAYKSERRCGCPDRDTLEQRRREGPEAESA